MTNGAADTWHARLGWAFDLVAEDPAARAAALAHLDAARRNARVARVRSNELWQLTLPLGPEERYREPAFERAREVYADMCGRSLPEALWLGERDRGPDLPYALLFLEWEARFPREWTEHAKAWGSRKRRKKARPLGATPHGEGVPRTGTPLLVSTFSDLLRWVWDLNPR
ncbi:hypothetical protein ACF065_14890 [Streptomyces sp. NPDC015232]|uniref:hypothetical protein n=1 Tax=unclassified Streptomyces TaxID=2593676 RepID=UPI0036F7D82B